MARKRVSRKSPTAPPERRNTIQIDPAWLLPSRPPPPGEEASMRASPAPKRAPPPLPQQARHDTIPVQGDWVDESSEQGLFLAPAAPERSPKVPPPLPWLDRRPAESADGDGIAGETATSRRPPPRSP